IAASSKNLSTCSVACSTVWPITLISFAAPNRDGELSEPLATPELAIFPPGTGSTPTISSAAMAPLQSPHCAHPTAAKSPASKTPARESSRLAAATPRSPAPHRAQQFPNPPAIQKLSAPPPRSALLSPNSAPHSISSAKSSQSARATRALSRPLLPAHAALPPSAFAYDPALRGCDANTQSNRLLRAIPVKAAHARAQ